MKVGTAQSFANSGSESNFQGLEHGVFRGWNSGFRVEGVQFRFKYAEKLPNQNDWSKKGWPGNHGKQNRVYGYSILFEKP